ncbi:ABC transporter substrate-binding protein [Celeribacter halophilus]|uniref:ABC transporter substrate-binding protein n=1 Tax=Celeribacter halophilus TaxID=576117 RepID=UPI003A8D03A6
MTPLTRRRFLQQATAGATVLGLSHLLDPTKAFASTPSMVADMLAGQTPKMGGMLVYGQTYPNWALGQSNRGTHPYYWLDLLTRSVWNTLTWVDEDFNVQLELARSLTSNDAMDVWDATLHEGVMFHDGTEMTADDVVSSMNLHMGGGVGLLRANVARTEKLGKYGVRFHLVQPNAEFPYALAEYRAVIMKAKENPDEIGYDGIGTGPFKLVDIDNARQFRAVRNDDYWMGTGPFLDEVRGVITPGNGAINGFRSGQLNAVWNIDPGQIEQFEDAGAQIHASAAGDQFYINLPKNLNIPWNDQRIRKAMSLAIDRKKINEIVYRDANGWTGNDSHMSGVNAEFVARPVERDVELARALLTEAGYPDGIKLPAIAFCPNFPEEPRIYPIVSESLAEAGIEIVFEERPCDGFSPYVDSVNAPFGRPHRNLVGPRNPFINLSRADFQRSENADWVGAGAEEYSRLVNTAVGEKDASLRLKMYQDAQRILQEEVPGIMLGGRRNMVAHAPNVKNARSHSQNWSSRFEYIWIDS